jgi:opacity protein-like surface antigen
MRIILAIVAVLCAGISGANAADTYARGSTKDEPFIASPSVPVASSWTSLWAAALVGYGMSNSELNLDLFASDGEGGQEDLNLARVDGFGGQGFNGALQLGGDVQMGRIVLGGFAEYHFGGIESEASIFDNAASLEVEEKDGYAFFGRAGVTVYDRTLIYAAIGWVHKEFEATTRFGDESSSADLEFDGIGYELGVEHKFTDNIRGRLSGRYTDLDEETVFKFGDDEFGGALKADPDTFEIKAGVVISTSGLGFLSR